MIENALLQARFFYASYILVCDISKCLWGEGPKMKIHEYQGKDILREYGVAVPNGKACFSVDETVAAAEEIGGSRWVVKAQIHAGGRGKGGGVKLADSLDEVRQHAGDILGMTLISFSLAKVRSPWVSCCIICRIGQKDHCPILPVWPGRKMEKSSVQWNVPLSEIWIVFPFRPGI